MIPGWPVANEFDIMLKAGVNELLVKLVDEAGRRGFFAVYPGEKKEFPVPGRAGAEWMKVSSEPPGAPRKEEPKPQKTAVPPPVKHDGMGRDLAELSRGIEELRRELQGVRDILRDLESLSAGQVGLSD
jgi:hypothetical protein